MSEVIYNDDQKDNCIVCHKSFILINFNDFGYQTQYRCYKCQAIYRATDTEENRIARDKAIRFNHRIITKRSWIE